MSSQGSSGFGVDLALVLLPGNAYCPSICLKAHQKSPLTRAEPGAQPCSAHHLHITEATRNQSMGGGLTHTAKLATSATMLYSPMSGHNVKTINDPYCSNDSIDYEQFTNSNYVDYSESNSKTGD